MFIFLTHCLWHETWKWWNCWWAHVIYGRRESVSYNVNQSDTEPQPCLCPWARDELVIMNDKADVSEYGTTCHGRDKLHTIQVMQDFMIKLQQNIFFTWFFWIHFHFWSKRSKDSFTSCSLSFSVFLSHTHKQSWFSMFRSWTRLSVLPLLAPSCIIFPKLHLSSGDAHFLWEAVYK